jgi:hypothetical protein
MDEFDEEVADAFRSRLIYSVNQPGLSLRLSLTSDGPQKGAPIERSISIGSTNPLDIAKRVAAEFVAMADTRRKGS